MALSADPTTQAAAALKMALRAVLLSGQATGRQRPENEQEAREARKDAGKLTPTRCLDLGKRTKGLNSPRY